MAPPPCECALTNSEGRPTLLRDVGSLGLWIYIPVLELHPWKLWVLQSGLTCGPFSNTNRMGSEVGRLSRAEFDLLRSLDIVSARVNLLLVRDAGLTVLKGLSKANRFGPFPPRLCVPF